MYLGQVVVQMVKNPTAMQETQVWFLGREDPLKKGMATHFSILAWRIPIDRGACRLQPKGSHRVRHDWATHMFTFTFNTSPVSVHVGIWCVCMFSFLPQFIFPFLWTKSPELQHLGSIFLFLVGFSQQVQAGDEKAGGKSVGVFMLLTALPSALSRSWQCLFLLNSYGQRALMTPAHCFLPLPLRPVGGNSFPAVASF